MRVLSLSSLVTFSMGIVGVWGKLNYPKLEARGGDLVLLNLTAWTQEHLEALNSATTNADVEAAADNFISKNVVIEINGANITRDAFIEAVQKGIVNRVNTTLDFTAAVQVPTDPQSPVTAGWVGFFFSATNIYGSPATKQIVDTTSDNILIQQDPSIPQPNTTLPIHGFFDGRRVMVIQRVSTEVTTTLGQ